MNNKLFILAHIALCVLPIRGFSQCVADGPRNATAFVNDASVGSIAWSTPANISASDNLRSSAVALVGILSTTNTNYLVETGFGFTLPPTAIVCGIRVDAERRQQGVIIGSSVKDNTIKIVKGGVIIGTEHASGASWPGADAYISYGGSADLWGTTWTPSDINAANFGIAYASASLNAGLAALFLTAEIDHVRITVFYDSPLPIELIEFSASCNNNSVELNWTTASQHNNDYFTIEKTIDSWNFYEVGIIDGAGNASQLMNYTFTDHRPSKVETYYRLKQTDFNGESKYFNVVPVKCDTELEQVFFPNPSTGKFDIEATGDVTIYNLYGIEILNKKNIEGKIEIDLSNQPNGIYFYQLKLYSITLSGKMHVQH